jgi:hypothetical protein
MTNLYASAASCRNCTLINKSIPWEWTEPVDSGRVAAGALAVMADFCCGEVA